MFARVQGSLILHFSESGANREQKHKPKASTFDMQLKRRVSGCPLDAHRLKKCNLRSGQILASLLFALTGPLAKIFISVGMGLPSETKVEPDRRLEEILMH